MHWISSEPGGKLSELTWLNHIYIYYRVKKKQNEEQYHWCLLIYRYLNKMVTLAYIYFHRSVWIMDQYLNKKL